MYCIPKIILFMCVFVAGAAGLGINCRGSSQCRKGVLPVINDYVQAIDVERVYNQGDHIACAQQLLFFRNEGFCLFLQFAPEGTTIKGGKVKELLGHLVAHGCEGCGSVPINFPESNDPAPGILTSNYVSDVGNCNGLC